MADFDNLAEINENFDTIKTLLNSIRAQGILNTSDVDKLLSGINMKLEKINTEEDIDLIKIFLSELKQNLDERHNLLISKFGAIESLFANLLKNSSEMLKSSEVKELFDIVATNLSVFSREVVSQKESLTDISLRLDAIRSDDSQKKDIIKNITILKSDIERLNNGFDSIVISLNDNFKTVVKTITTLDKTEEFDKFSNVLTSIEISSNTVLSALQMLDKKAEQVELALKDVATKDDISGAAQKIFELSAQSHELTAAVSDLNNKYVKFDTLSEKIDASVNIIAGLKSVLEEADNTHTQKILSELNTIQDKLVETSTETKFEEIKTALNETYKYIQERMESLGSRSVLVFEEIQKLAAFIQALDIQQGLESVQNNIKIASDELATEIEKKAQAVSTLNETNITRVINEISNNADTLTSKLTQAQSEIGIICEKNFSSVFEKVADVKALIAQIDENSVSANNAIFSSITDRLSLFETSLRESLELQEKTVLSSSAQLVEHIENIKNVSNMLDYKLDTSVVEAANVKREFADLRTSVENVLSLDFTNVVKDLRIDLYAVKQELSNSFENSSSELTERFTSDLYGKYELLVSKIDSVEEDLKKVQISSLNGLKGVLDNISSSLVDILSYVSDTKSTTSNIDDAKFDEVINLINDSNINYVENVRDIVDVIRVQVETNIKSFEEEALSNFDNVKKVISENSEDIKKEIKYSYTKLLELQDSYSEIQELLNITKESDKNSFAEVLAATDTLKSGVESKLNLLKDALINNITDFKTDFTCENADKISEIKFSIESLYSKNAQEVQNLVNGISDSLSKLSIDQIDGRAAALAKLSDEFSALKDLLYSLQDKTSEIYTEKTNTVLNDLKSIRTLLPELQDKTSNLYTEKTNAVLNNLESIKTLLPELQDKTSDLYTEKTNAVLNNLESIKTLLPELQDKTSDLYTEKTNAVLNNLESIRTLLPELQDKTSDLYTEKTNTVLNNLESIKALLPELQDKSCNFIDSKLQTIIDELAKAQDVINKLNEDVDGDMSRQLSIIESNFESLVSQITILFDKSDISLSNRIETEFSKVSSLMQDNISEKLDNYKETIENVFVDLKNKTLEQSDYLQERISELHSTLKEIWDEQSKSNAEQISSLTQDLKNILDEKLELSKYELNDMRNNLEAFSQEINSQNEELNTKLNAQIDDIAKYVNTVLDIQAQENEERQSEINTLLSNLTKEFANNKDTISKSNSEILETIENLKTANTTSAKDQLLVIDAYINNILEQFDVQKNNINSCKDMILKAFKTELEIISTNVEKETDIVIGELIEQFDLLKKSQNDEFVNLTSKIEEIINAQVYNNIEDLKSYLDIKTDNSVLNTKFDNLKLEITASIDSVIESAGKLLESSAFASSMSDFKLANEVLINNAIDSLNSRIEDFITSNLTDITLSVENNSKNISDKLSLFDKKFVDLLVEKFEEIKLTASSYNNSYEKIQVSINEIISEFDYVKQSINNEVDTLSQLIKNSVTATNSAIAKLNDGFNDLRQEILDRASDET